MSFAPIRRKSGEDESISSTTVELTEYTASHHPSQVSVDVEDDAASDTSSNHQEILSTHDTDLSMLQAATLLTADCLGTGLLALPQDIKVLGNIVGLSFLILNLPISWYAGSILSHVASLVEGIKRATDEEEEAPNGDGLVRAAGKTKNKSSYASVLAKDKETAENSRQDDDSATHDYIGMTREIFHHPWATHMVIAVFYTNIFLVLGDYILVMAHAVKATVGEDSICLPTAGLLASTLMFGFSQLRTMANIGRTVTVLSLSSLAIVVIQCLVAAERNEPAPGTYVLPSETSVLRKLSALASIGFATGSNKLLLNIRNEMNRRDESPKSLGISLSIFGSVYVAICVLAGPSKSNSCGRRRLDSLLPNLILTTSLTPIFHCMTDPPSFLFDLIPTGLNRRVAGLLLWIHVAVSYAINSQAMCSSMDRLFFHRIALFGLERHPKRRWLLLTLLLAVSSYLVANAVPFFKDLVALIGVGPRRNAVLWLT
jgi:amino acid permease